MTLWVRLLGFCLILGATTPGMAGDPTVGPVPAGSTIERPGAEPVVLEAPRWLITRGMLDRANAAQDRAEALEQRLETVLKQDRPRPWVQALKWGAVGIAIAGAFAAGLMVP